MSDLLLAALLGALPLPLTGLVPWWAAALYAAPLAVQAWRLRASRSPASLDPRWMNLLSLACLAMFIVDMMFLSRRLIHVAVHLSLSLIALKSFHLSGSRDRAQFALLAFFLAVAGAANSTHPLLMLHLLVLAALFLSWLMQATGLPPYPARRSAILLTLAALALGAPLFLLLPRLRDPYVSGARQVTGTADPQTFTLDSLGLEGVSRSKDDQRVAFRVRPEGMAMGEESLRLRARTFSDFKKKKWSSSAVRYRMGRFRSDGQLWLGEGEGRGGGSLEIFPKELSPLYLPLPYDAAGLEARLRYAHQGDDGTVRLSNWVSQRLFHYRVFVEAGAGPELAPPREAHMALPPGMERELTDLAFTIMPDGMAPADQTQAVVRYFARGYRYALEDYAGEEDPLREFLFVRKRGHCELYATAGALLLRARGIPARVAVGFMGGERNPLQDYYVVRFSNAHAWVEAWVDGSWRIVDPTPPEFRPVLQRGSLAGQAGYLWESVSFFWDRYIIGFAFSDQVDLARAAETYASPAMRVGGWLLGALAVVMAGLWGARSLRPEPAALRRYRTLRRGASRLAGLPEPTLSPQEVERIIVELDPALAGDAASFFDAYRAISFGGRRTPYAANARKAGWRLRSALRRRLRRR